MKKRRGRPTRAETTARALQGIDVDAVDVRAVLRRVAADPSSPASARVSACRALLADEERERIEKANRNNMWPSPTLAAPYKDGQ